MKKFKRIGSLLLVVCLALDLAACAGALAEQSDEVTGEEDVSASEAAIGEVVSDCPNEDDVILDFSGETELTTTEIPDYCEEDVYVREDIPGMYCEDIPFTVDEKGNVGFLIRVYDRMEFTGSILDESGESVYYLDPDAFESDCFTDDGTGEVWFGLQDLAAGDYTFSLESLLFKTWEPTKYEVRIYTYEQEEFNVCHFQGGGGAGYSRKRFSDA